MARVLYIEDDNNNRLLVERVLLAEGYDVVTADTAELGIEIAASDPPDIILMDINMPNMDGYMATAALRQLPQLDHIPIIAVTANVMKGDKEETLAAGCDGYISKPIDIDRFPEEIEHFLRKNTRR
jgi:two-component system, cell cycle response regulator DivK